MFRTTLETELKMRVGVYEYLHSTNLMVSVVPYRGFSVRTYSLLDRDSGAGKRSSSPLYEWTAGKTSLVETSHKERKFF